MTDEVEMSENEKFYDDVIAPALMDMNLKLEERPRQREYRFSCLRRRASL